MAFQLFMSPPNQWCRAQHDYLWDSASNPAAGNIIREMTSLHHLCNSRCTAARAYTWPPEVLVASQL